MAWPIDMQPRLRDLQTTLTRHEGNAYIVLRDPLGMSEEMILVPQALAPLLGLCDGSRDLATLRTAFELRTGISLRSTVLEQLIHRLDEALLLDNERFAQAHDAALSEFRAAPARPPVLAGRSYPADPGELKDMIKGYLSSSQRVESRRGGLGTPDPGLRTREGDSGLQTPDPGLRTIDGLITPHIDFQRGSAVYAHVWGSAARTIQDTELAIIFGTDHLDGRNLFTLTKQHYSTPWGTLPTAGDMVDRVADALGRDIAFEDELHHRNEHSVELAAVWLHYFLGARGCELLPILCSSFTQFMLGDNDPLNDEQIAAMIDSLRAITRSRRTLLIAAVDLAHMGPAFGDRYPIDAIERARVTAADERLIQAMCAADADGFFAQIKRERNRRRICGMAPIYLTLRLLDGARGKALGYMQCPADATGASLVSICGVVLGDRG